MADGDRVQSTNAEQNWYKQSKSFLFAINFSDKFCSAAAASWLFNVLEDKSVVDKGSVGNMCAMESSTAFESNTTFSSTASQMSFTPMSCVLC